MSIVAQIQIPPDISREVSAVLSMVIAIGRGGVLTHDHIFAKTNFLRESREYPRLIKHLKRDALEAGLQLVATPGVGYKVLSVDEQLVDRPARERKSVLKKLGKAARCVLAIKPHELDESQKRLQAVQAGSFALLEMATRESTKQLTLQQPSPARIS